MYVAVLYVLIYNRTRHMSLVCIYDLYSKPKSLFSSYICHMLLDLSFIYENERICVICVILLLTYDSYDNKDLT